MVFHGSPGIAGFMKIVPIVPCGKCKFVNAPRKELRKIFKREACKRNIYFKNVYENKYAISSC
jgi:hypothetical protein